MKRSIVLLLFFFGSFNASSQLQYKTGQLYLSPFIAVGAPAILNQNNFGFGEMAYKLKVGKQAGIMFGYDSYLKTSFRFGILYSEVGQKYGDILINTPHEKDIHLTYIHIPAVYKYVFGDTKSYDFREIYKYIFVGVQLGYLIDAKIDWIRDGKNVAFIDFISFGPYKDENKNLEEILNNGKIDRDIEFFSKFDFSLVGGLGIQFFLSRKIMFFSEMVGNFGIRDVNAPRWRFRNNKKVYNQSLNLLAEFRLGLNFYL